MIRILLVDDHRLVRASLRAMLDGADDLLVAGEADSGEQALATAAACRADVVLMDVNMPGIGGLEATRRLLAAPAAPRVIALTAHDDDPYPARMLEAGASGYLTKHCGPDELVSAIRAVAGGDDWIDAAVARRIAGDALAGRDRADPLAGLSQRELQVLTLVTHGHSTRDIAGALQLSPKTVATYRYRLYEKLGVANDVELARLGLRCGIA